MEKQLIYYGEFNENGYEIFENDPQKDAVYRAGNCQFDSYQWLPVGAKGTIDIITIEKFCEQTGKELAQEKGAKWQGCQRIDNIETEND